MAQGQGTQLSLSIADEAGTQGCYGAHREN